MMRLLHLTPRHLVIGGVFVFTFLVLLHAWTRPCTVADDYCRIYRPDVKLAFVTSYYQPQDKERASELDVSLASLIANPMVDQVHVLFEPRDHLPPFATNSPKVIQHQIPTRPLVGDFVQFICDNIDLQHPHHRALFANGDIAFDSSLDYFSKISDHVFDSTFYAISRLELQREPGIGLSYSPFDRWGSSDTWAFKPKTICRDKAKLQEIVRNLNYTLGHLGGENRLLYEIRRQYPNLKWVNPCKSVRTIHVHSSKSRGSNWSDRVNLDGKTFQVPLEFTE